MGGVFQAGSTITAADLDLVYANADTAQTTVIAAVQTPLSSLYIIPAGEAQQFSAYELTCGGDCTWGSTPSPLTFQFQLGSTSGGMGAGPTIAAANFAASADIRWKAKMTVVCADGVQLWWGGLDGCLTESASNILDPGGSSSTTSEPFSDANKTAHTALVTGPITAGIYAAWGTAGAAGGSITNYYTVFRKIA